MVSAVSSDNVVLLVMTIAGGVRGHRRLGADARVVSHLPSRVAQRRRQPSVASSEIADDRQAVEEFGIES